MKKRAKKRKPLTWAQKDEIVQLYGSEHLSSAAIAQRFGVSRQGIYKVLQNLGVDTSKAVGCHVDVQCRYCEKVISKTRAQYRQSTHHYCDYACYKASLTIGGTYKENRHGSRKSRSTAALFYGPLPDGSIVHHEDKNQYNSHPHNLYLFESQRDHIRWHRGLRHLVTPLWIGKSLTQEEISAKWS